MKNQFNNSESQKPPREEVVLDTLYLTYLPFYCLAKSLSDHV